jgi:hypothetical protein
MFEILSVGENPYHFHRPAIRNKDYKEWMKREYE